MNGRQARQKRADIKELSSIMLNEFNPDSVNIMYMILLLFGLSSLASTWCVIFVSQDWRLLAYCLHFFLFLCCLPVVRSHGVQALMVKALQRPNLKSKTWRRVYKSSKRRG